MLPIKLDLTEELAATLRQLRLEHPVNGEILTAENLSKAIGNNRAWMSQIESRRLKKIKREDIIKIYKLLYNETDDYKAEYRAELALETFYTNTDAIIPLNSNSNLENELEFIEEAPESDSYYNRKSFYFLMDRLNDALSEKFSDFIIANDLESQANFLQLLVTLTSDVGYAYDDTRIFLEKLPLQLLKYATPDEHHDILSKLDYISNLLQSFNIRYIEQTYIKRIEDHKNNMFFTKDIQSLIYGLTDLTKLVEQNDLIKGSIIQYINDFTGIVKKYYLAQNIPIPININELSDSSSKSDWKNTIDKLQLLLSDSKDSHFFIRGKLTDNIN